VAEHFELIVFGLLVAVAGLVLLSDVLEVPYPIFLVLGGLVLGFIPGVPEVKLAPELVLLRGLPAGRGIEHFGYTRVGGPGSGDSG
jgi:monovalent cation/hydrogen antiporter